MTINDILINCGLSLSWTGFLTTLSQQDYIINLDEEEKTKLITCFACEILNMEK